MLCESLQTTAATKDVMNLIKDVFEKHDIPLEKVVYVCSKVAPVMLGCKSGFVATVIKHEFKLNHNPLHITPIPIESKTLPDNLKKMMDSVVYTVNFI